VTWRQPTRHISLPPLEYLLSRMLAHALVSFCHRACYTNHSMLDAALLLEGICRLLAKQPDFLSTGLLFFFAGVFFVAVAVVPL
jgi:hypothetical protein